MSGAHCSHCILESHACMHQDTRITVTRHHAGGAMFAAIGDLIEIKDRTKRFVPGFATPDVQIPIDVEIFVACDAGEVLPFAADMPLDVIYRSSRIEHRESFLECFD